MMMDILTRPWRHYFDFEGRSRRTEFALFHLSFWIIVFLAVTLGNGLVQAPGRAGRASPLGLVVIVPLTLFWLASLLPSLALTVRRLHDQNKTGWALLLFCLPAANILFALILLFGPGTDGPNQYGDDPRWPEADQFAAGELRETFS